MKVLTLFLTLATVGFAQETRFAPVEAADAYKSSENVIQVDIEGYLPNSCYGDPRVKYKQSKVGNKIYVKVLSFVEEGPCAQVIEPFSFTADLGSYRDGVYEVIVQPRTRYQIVDTVVVD